MRRCRNTLAPPDQPRTSAVDHVIREPEANHVPTTSVEVDHGDEPSAISGGPVDGGVHDVVRDGGEVTVSGVPRTLAAKVPLPELHPASALALLSRGTDLPSMPLSPSPDDAADRDVVPGDPLCRIYCTVTSRLVSQVLDASAGSTITTWYDPVATPDNDAFT